MPLHTRGSAAASPETVQQRYTMQSERTVHELFAVKAFTGGALSGATAALGATRTNDDLGDNVELF